MVFADIKQQLTSPNVFGSSNQFWGELFRVGVLFSVHVFEIPKSLYLFAKFHCGRSLVPQTEDWQ